MRLEGIFGDFIAACVAYEIDVRRKWLEAAPAIAKAMREVKLPKSLVK